MKNFIAGEDIKKGDLLVIDADGTVRKAVADNPGPFFSDNMSEVEKQAAREGYGTSK